MLSNLFCSSTVAEALAQETVRPTHMMIYTKHTTGFVVRLAEKLDIPRMSRTTHHEDSPRELRTCIGQADFFVSRFVHLLAAARVRVNFEGISTGKQGKQS